ncbi:hypothetical protein FACS189487_10060 [Campylobacterota bacterium]|nr:hypothetical protein FACS189487_10060 [Campylobacterota bacterium]
MKAETKLVIKTVEYTLLCLILGVVLYGVFYNPCCSDYFCDLFENEDAYRKAKELSIKTWDGDLTFKVLSYESGCIKNRELAEKTNELMSAIHDETKIFRSEISEILLKSDKTRTATLIRLNYMSSKQPDNRKKFNEYSRKATDILLNSCDDICIKEIFRTHHNLLFNYKIFVEPCEIVEEDLNWRIENIDEDWSLRKKHYDFLDKYCRNYEPELLDGEIIRQEKRPPPPIVTSDQ